MLKKISLSGDISITKWCFVTNFYQFSLFIKTFLLVVTIALQIEFVVFVYKLIITLLLGYVIITSTSYLQSTTAITNQLPGQLVSTQIDYM